MGSEVGIGWARMILGWSLLAEALEAMAWVTAAQGQVVRAAQLGGAADVLREELGAALHPVLHAGHARAVQAIREALGEDACTAAWAEGQALSLEETIGLASGAPVAPPGPS